MNAVRNTLEHCATQRLDKALDTIARRQDAGANDTSASGSGGALAEDRIETGDHATVKCFGVLERFPNTQKRIALRIRDFGTGFLDRHVRLQNGVMRFSHKRQTRNVRDIVAFAAQHAQAAETKRVALRIALQVYAPAQYRSMLNGVPMEIGKTGIPIVGDLVRDGALSGLVMREAERAGLMPRDYLALTPGTLIGGVTPALGQTVSLLKVATHANWQRGIWFRRRRVLPSLTARRIQQAMEKDGAMLVDENGRRFYDAYETPEAIAAAQARWQDIAARKMQPLETGDEEEAPILPRNYQAAADRLNYQPIHPSAAATENDAENNMSLETQRARRDAIANALAEKLPALDAQALELLRQRNALQRFAAAGTIMGAVRGAWDALPRLRLQNFEPAHFVYEVAERAGYETNVNYVASSLSVQRSLIEKAQRLEQVHADLYALREMQVFEQTRGAVVDGADIFYDPHESSDSLQTGLGEIARATEHAMPHRRLFAAYPWSSGHGDMGYLPTDGMQVVRRIFTRLPNELPGAAR